MSYEIGWLIQWMTPSRDSPANPSTEATNHNVNGTSAMEVRRSAHQVRTPDFAAPSPRARASGERMTEI